ncbi:unnamed protein product [Peniophora sp. CBMAI 1063]|nr:unnamed protein product [Peniophora sp. CBMAI 1063]
MRSGHSSSGAMALCLLLSASVAVAQNLTIPTEIWLNSTSGLGRDTRADLASSAAKPFATLSIAVGQPGMPFLPEVTSVFAALALQDYYLGTNTWQSMGTSTLLNTIRERNGFWSDGKMESSDPAYWGLASFYSYRTYNATDLLDNAKTAWDIVYNAFITPSAAASGSGAGRNVSFSPPTNCTAETFAGGVFLRQDVMNNTEVNMLSVGPFMALSAYLYEATQNSTYHDSAQLSLDFIIHHLWNGSFVSDSIDLSSCQITPKPWTLNQAWFIEGLSVWANVTHNDTLTTLLENAVPSIATYPSWTSHDGTTDDFNPDITSATPNSILKGIYIRSFTEARMRNPGTQLAQYIEAYITVQFNSILEHAQAAPPNNSYYSREWTGPPATFFEAGGNIAALDVLNGAVSLVDASSSNTSTTTPGPNSTGTPRTTSKKSASAGPIAGGVVGGVVAIAVAVAAIFLCRRRQRKVAPNTLKGDFDASDINLVDPFVSRPAHNPIPPTKFQRMNGAYRGDGPSAAPTQPISVTVDSTRDSDSPRNTTHENAIAELPGLVDRLQNLLQGRQPGELPPQYGD